MTRITTHRALLDWYRRPRKRSRGEVNSDTGEGSQPFPGIVGMTKHRITIDLSNKRIAATVLQYCDDAIADEWTSEAKLGQIIQTRKEVVRAMEEADG